MMSEEFKKEMIKPSSPTPPNLRNLQLLFLDQLAPPAYIHIILYFEAHHESFTASPEFKASLSDALAVYYPLADRLRDNSWVDCNDVGAEYIEAQFNDIQISDVVNNRRIENMTKFVPLTPSGTGDVPLAVQVSYFGCGGTAVGICMWHGLVDAISMVAFLNTWAAACRQDSKTISSFDVSSRFWTAAEETYLLN